ncbi:SAM-dependent methyltransferase [Streptosporangium lutulentum]
MYDYYLGGKDNFAADRAAAQKIIDLAPDAPEKARANRAFLGRTVRYLAAQGIRQFVDIGASLPTQENVHQVALAEHPDSRIVYVDNDPVVLTHARALLADNPNTLVVEGDVHAPQAILDHPDVQAHLDFDRPVATLLLAVLHFVQDDEEANRIVASLRERLVPGSHLVISHIYPGNHLAETIRAGARIYDTTTASLTGRSLTQIAATSPGIWRFWSRASSRCRRGVPSKKWGSTWSRPGFWAPSARYCAPGCAHEDILCDSRRCVAGRSR